jgi:maleamate amidohydrolase
MHDVITKKAIKRDDGTRNDSGLNDSATYERQGFGSSLDLQGPYGLLVVDFVNGFADPAVFGGGNIAQAIANTVPLLAAARRSGWPVAHTRIVYADDGADHNVFSMKVPNMLSLKEHDRNSAVVDDLAPAPGELVVRKNVPSAFFGTGLSAWLTQRGVRTLLVAGAVTSGCVRASVVDAMQYGFQPLVVSDCVGDRAIGPHDANLFDMRQKYATVMPRDAALQAVGIRA